MESLHLKQTLKASCRVALTLAIGISTAPAWAQQTAAPAPDSIYGESYSSPGVVVAEQARVVFFREADGKPQAAHIYLDGSLQNALMPGGFTEFCVAPGSHALEAYVADAPDYAGKRNPHVQANFEGGRTYFLEVASDATDPTPTAVPREEAEKQLQGLRRQTHIVDRSDAIVPCKTLQQTQFSLRGDVLFRFGKSAYQDITEQGHVELRKVADEIKSEPFALESVEVNGYADPIGSRDANMTLSQERARTVRSALLDLGVRDEIVHAIGHGSSDAIVRCPTKGPLRARIDCNAPNRRVDVVIRGVKVEK